VCSLDVLRRSVGPKRLSGARSRSRGCSLRRSVVALIGVHFSLRTDENFCGLQVGCCRDLPVDGRPDPSLPGGFWMLFRFRPGGM